MSKQRKPNTSATLQNLKDFQRRTVDYVFHRLYEADDAVDRFLVADEVGLGKTLVARGIIARAIDKLWAKKGHRIDVLYICANRDIARQNINRLNISGNPDIALATRMTLLPLKVRDLQNKRLNFVSFTPETSFNLRSGGGVQEERVLLYYLLQRAWGFGNEAPPKNVLQVRVKRENWHRNLRNFNQKEIDPGLAEKFITELARHPELRSRFKKLLKHFRRHRRRSNIPQDVREKQIAFVGSLRRLLARSCVKALEPDLIILDEFQRFKNLISDDTTDETVLLAQALFEYPGAKTLLLSATPYKMYTLHNEAEDDHYADFIDTVKFLFNDDRLTEQFTTDLRRYREALFRLAEDGSNDLLAAKTAIECQLRRVMVRTERLAATANRDGMITETLLSPRHLEPRDLWDFVVLDGVARALDAGDVVRYWQSAPYVLNMMDRGQDVYKLKQKLIDAVEESPSVNVLEALQRAAPSLLPWSDIQTYRKIDPGNAKLRDLLEKTINRGAWALLWVPPSLPYYRPAAGPYLEPTAQDFSKMLVFSTWRIVPKVIATLASYEAERRMVNAFEAQADYLTERRKRRPLLRFARVDGRQTGMANFTLLYPSLTLALSIDPLKIGAELAQSGNLPDVTAVTAMVIEKINALLQPILNNYTRRKGRTDERWYWAALAMLDRRYYRKFTKFWFADDETENVWQKLADTRAADEADTHFADHIEQFQKVFSSPRKLGPPPADLVEVLAKVALASPAVTALRALWRVSRPKAMKKAAVSTLMNAAAKVAWGFRTLFNLPDTMTLLRSEFAAGKDETRYWESVLDYSVDGNLQATLDEYTHILRESLGLMAYPPENIAAEIADEMQKAVSIRTASLNVDEILPNGAKTLRTRKIRCRFALRFGDESDGEKGELRAGQVRTAFNSPFRPFILATTSVGQEGLDFHQYCHQVYHWNLPANPVDLEQREGRVHRYKGHVIRRNVAQVFPLTTFNDNFPVLGDPWQLIFEQAQARYANGQNELTPYWIFEPGEGYKNHKIIRHIPALPLSRDRERLEDLHRSLATYRLVFGQPRQEDLLAFLREQFDGNLSQEALIHFRIDLTPPETSNE